MWQTWKNGLHLAKNKSHLNNGHIWLNGSQFIEGVTLGIMSDTWPNGSHLKKMGHTWKNTSQLEKKSKTLNNVYVGEFASKNNANFKKIAQTGKMSYN